MPAKPECRFCLRTDRLDPSGLVCARCLPVSEAFERAARRMLDPVKRAFFRGWTTGAGDVERQENPYAPFIGVNTPGDWWAVGFRCGQLHSRELLARQRRRRRSA